MKENPLARLPKLPEFGSNRPFYYSALLHAVLILFFVVGIDWQSSKPIQPAGTPQVMTATAVDASKAAPSLEKLKAPEPEKIETVKPPEEDALEKVEREEQKMRELREQQEQQKREESERKQVEEKRKVEAQKKLETEKKKKAEAEKKAKAEAEKKKKAEAEKKAKAEAEKKAKAEAAKALADELAAEEAEAAAAAQGVADGNEIQRYLGRIQAAVSGGFVYPAGLPPGLKCTLFVRLIPGGEVVEARVVQSSGNAVFDRQAENAVRRAAPLPVPPEARLFNQMREFTFVFEP